MKNSFHFSKPQKHLHFVQCEICMLDKFSLNDHCLPNYFHFQHVHHKLYVPLTCSFSICRSVNLHWPTNGVILTDKSSFHGRAEMLEYIIGVREFSTGTKQSRNSTGLKSECAGNYFLMQWVWINMMMIMVIVIIIFHLIQLEYVRQRYYSQFLFQSCFK